MFFLIKQSGRMIVLNSKLTIIGEKMDQDRGDRWI